MHHFITFHTPTNGSHTLSLSLHTQRETHIHIQIHTRCIYIFLPIVIRVYLRRPAPVPFTSFTFSFPLLRLHRALCLGFLSFFIFVFCALVLTDNPSSSQTSHALFFVRWPFISSKELSSQIPSRFFSFDFIAVVPAPSSCPCYFSFSRGFYRIFSWFFFRFGLSGSISVLPGKYLRTLETGPHLTSKRFINLNATGQYGQP